VFAQLQDEKIEAFLPLQTTIRQWSDRKKKVMEPLFRGYLFVKTDLRNRLDILQTDGVVNFVNTRGKPAAIPDRQIDWVKTVVAHPGTVSREQYLNVGERVRIVRGPFSGIEGIVIRHKGVMRIVLSLEVIFQAVSVEVSETMVERIPVVPTRALRGERTAEAQSKLSGY